jgi:hypothetical protein
VTRASGSRRRWRGRASQPPLALSGAWRSWVAENAVAGAGAAELVDALVSAAVPAPLARREVTAVLASPLLELLRASRLEAARLELVPRLLRHVARASPCAASIERLASLDAGDFLARYYAASRPVVLTELLRGWPAVERWTPAYLAERWGDVEVEVMTGELASSTIRTRGPEERRRVLMRDLVAHVTAPEGPIELYLEGYNRALEQPEFAPLLDDLRPPDALFDPARARGAVSLWLGPRATFTPLHHDATNIMFCLVHGRKRLRLVSPLETSLLRAVHGAWTTAPLAELLLRAEHAGVVVHEIELVAGEALFLPAGWWHEVEAIEPSIHVSMTHFRQPNDLSFYRPGFLGP